MDKEIETKQKSCDHQGYLKDYLPWICPKCDKDMSFKLEYASGEPVQGILMGKCVNCHWENWSNVLGDKTMIGNKCNECFKKYPKCNHFKDPDTENSVNVCENC